jgi:hypothetical protein
MEEEGFNGFASGWYAKQKARIVIRDSLVANNTAAQVSLTFSVGGSCRQSTAASRYHIMLRQLLSTLGARRNMSHGACQQLPRPGPSVNFVQCVH